MITLKKLYFDPNPKNITPIIFDRGINFIIGERSKSITNQSENKKMNGVGKSISIEMINYCLMKDFKKNRVSKIPEPVLPSDISICLDLEIETPKSITNITIKRFPTEHSPIIIIEDHVSTELKGIEEAKKYLDSLFNKDNEDEITERPSLRSMLSLLIRDERTSYDNVLYPYPESSLNKFGEIIKPHLYFFDFDLSLVDKIKKIDKFIEETKKVISSLKRNIKDEGINPKDLDIYLNELRDKVEKLNFSIEELKPGEGINQAREELTKLEGQIRKLTSEKVSRDYSVKQIKNLPKLEKVNSDEVKEIYNQFKGGLGDLVQKSLDQVQLFQSEIENFHRQLMEEKLNALNEEISTLDIQIELLNNQISRIYSQYKSSEEVHALRDAITQFQEKNRKLEMLTSVFSILKDKNDTLKVNARSRSKLLEKLDAQIISLNKRTLSFKNDLERAHQYIAGNKACHFDIEISEKGKEFIIFDYRIKLDGSSGINRIKTFIYDALLMLNNYTSKKHLGFLIHDNIFASVGKDDMVQALNYLNGELARLNKFQYILTINKDEFDSCVNKFDFDYKQKTRAIFTRKDPFLKEEYPEV